MPDDDPHRRYLIAVGITTDLPKSGPLIVASVNRMVRVLTGDFGYERVTQLEIDPASDQIRKSIVSTRNSCDGVLASTRAVGCDTLARGA